MSDKVTVVRPDGSTISVSPEDAEQLSGLGYKEQTPLQAHETAVVDAAEDYYTTGGQRAATFAEGIASGASLGASDYIAGNVLDWDTSERARHNPGTRIAGEIIGGIAPAIATGGESAIAQALSRTPAGLLAKGAKALAGGSIAGAAAIEGAGLGASAAFTTSTLNGDPLTAEAVIAGAGWGAVFGGGLGFLASKATKVGSKVVAEGEEIAAKSLIPDEKWGVFRSSVDDVKRTAQATIDEVTSIVDNQIPRGKMQFADDTITSVKARDIKARGYSQLPGVGDDAIKMNKARAAIAEGQRDPISMAMRGDGSMEVLDGRHRLQAAIEADAPIKVKWSHGVDVADTERVAAARESRDVAQKQLINDATAAGKMDAPARLARSEAMKVLNKATMAAAEGNIPRFEALLAEHSEKMQAFAKITGLAAPELEPFVLHAAKTSEAALNTVKDLRAIRDSLDRFPSTVEGLKATNYKKMEKHAAALDHFLAGAGGAELEGVRSSLRQSITDMGAAVGITTEGSMGKQFRAIWEATNKVESVAGAATKVAKEKPIISKGKIEYLGGRLAASQVGPGEVKKFVAYEVGSRLLAGVLGLKSAVIGGVSSAVKKWVPAAGRAAVRVGVPQRIDPLRTRLDGTTDEAKVSRHALMALRAEEIRRAAPTIRDSLYRNLAPVSAVHPEFTAAVMETAARQFGTLSAYLPRDPGTAFSRMKSMWKADAVAMEKFARVYEVFQNPVAVAQRALTDGRITTEAATALRQFNPEVFQLLRVGMLERLAEPGNLDKLTYSEQVNLGRLLSLTIHSTQSPRFIAAQQQMYQQRNEPLNVKPPAGSNSNNPSGGRPPGVSAATAITEH